MGGDFLSYFGYLPLDLSSNVRLTEWFHGFGKEIEVQSDIKWSCRARSFLLEIVIMLNKVYQEFVLDGKEITNTVINGNYVELALNYIHSNYPDNIKVDDLVRLVNVNKTTLNDKFKLRTGFPIMEYILNYRIDLACSTLRLTDLNLSEIAYMCGFNHETYFIKQFKKRKGLTPTQFRKNAVKDRKEALGPFNK